MESPSLLKDVILGFMGNPVEIILVVAGLLTLLILVLAVYIYGNRKRLRRKMTRSREMYDSRTRELALTPEENDLLQRMYSYLPNPQTKKHLLLSNQSLFNLCSSRLMKDQEVEDATIASLWVMLGFKRRSIEKQINSTVLLPTQIFLLIVQRETKKFYGRIISSDADGLVIRINESSVITPGIGSSLVCYFKTRSGTFHFSTTVLRLNGRTFRIAHSESIEHSQKRKYYRAKISMEALIRLAGSEESLTPTRIVDISGGGATLINPERRFRIAEDVQIVFKTQGRTASGGRTASSGSTASSDRTGTEYSIVAEIARLSKDDDIMHLTFGPLNESTRDRIISFVLNQRKKKMH